VALLINFSNNTSTFEKPLYPRPIIVQTVVADEPALGRSPVTKERITSKE
jgi:hypothetical protein